MQRRERLRAILAWCGSLALVPVLGARRWTRAAAAGCLAAALALSIWPWVRPGDGRLRITFLDVGQGDSAFVVFPHGKTMLVDGGGGDVRETRDGGGHDRERQGGGGQDRERHTGNREHHGGGRDQYGRRGPNGSEGQGRDTNGADQADDAAQSDESASDPVG